MSLYFLKKYACEQIPNILKHNDEPLQIVQNFQLQSLVPLQEKVTVALSGDGGDELFGGYNRYLLNKIWNKYSLLPYPINKICINLLKLLPYNLFDLINEKFNFIDLNNIQDKANKIIDKLNRSNNINELYVNLLSEWNDSEKLIKYYENLSQKKLNDEIKNLNFSNLNEMMMYMDFKYYLPDDILCKVDRSA